MSHFTRPSLPFFILLSPSIRPAVCNYFAKINGISLQTSVFTETFHPFAQASPTKLSANLPMAYSSMPSSKSGVITTPGRKAAEAARRKGKEPENMKTTTRTTWKGSLEAANKDLKRTGYHLSVLINEYGNYLLFSNKNTVKPVFHGEYYRREINETIRKLHIDLLLADTHFTCIRKGRKYTFIRTEKDGHFIPDRQSFRQFENARGWAAVIAITYQCQPYTMPTQLSRQLKADPSSTIRTNKTLNSPYHQK